MIEKKLSIITPYHNTLKYIEELAKVLEPQLTEEVEWIIIDDGDHEKELDKRKAMTLHLEKNSGNASIPRNVGLDYATGKFITFIDSDDLVSTNYVEKILEKIEKEEFDYCYFGWRTKDNIYKIEDEPLEWNRCVWNCLYKKETIGNTRFDPRYNINEDGIFNDKVRTGKKANILDILYYYNWDVREDSLSSLCRNGRIQQIKE